MKRTLYIAVSMLLLLLISSCIDHRYYADSENALNTFGYYELLDHIAAYYPSGIALNFPGYIVGFEESSTRLVTNGEEDILLDDTVYKAGFTVKRLLKTLRYNAPFISQVMRYEGQPYGEGNCALYNLYQNVGATIVETCNEKSRAVPPSIHDYSSTFANSWNAIDILKEQLNEDVEENDHTHLIVAVMGLDTAQEEAIRNYKSIVSSIRKESGSSFRPLFVGVTWPSFYANRWFDPLWEMLAYSPIADRADVLGLSWIGVLINEAVLPLSDRLEITIIAHSFGARAVSMGVCVGPALQRNSAQGVEQKTPRKIENFIGIAPAFSLKRFVDEDELFYENIYYKDYCPVVNRFVFTASSNDGALSPLFWANPVGDYDQMNKYCGQEQPISVVCTAATSDGSIVGYDTSAKVSYIDTSLLMQYSMPGTGRSGQGHSDIYRPEIGRLLWSVINGI